MQGATYVFTRLGNSWSQSQELIPSDGAAGDDLSWSVSCSADGSVIVIGAPGKTIGLNTDQGAVYVY